MKQQVALLKTEKVNLSFTDDGIKEIARVAFEVLTLSLSLSRARSLSHAQTNMPTVIPTRQPSERERERERDFNVGVHIGEFDDRKHRRATAAHGD